MKKAFTLIVLLATALFFGCAVNRKADLKSANRVAPHAERTTQNLVDLNSASKTQLIGLPGVGEAYAQKIIDGRPYHDKRELVWKNIVSQKTYEMCADQIIARQN